MMFRAVFRNTFRILFRSTTFWLVLAVFGVIMVRWGLTPHVMYMEGYEPLQISFSDFASELITAVYAGVNYPLSIFTVVATVLVLNRDYGDSFFEIEKAAGIKPSHYLLGRMSAVAVVAFAAQWILGFIELQLAVFNRGGLEGYSFLRYLGLSVFRWTYVNLCISLPNILFYVGLVYLIGTLLRNGIAAAISGFVYIMFSYEAFFRLRYEIKAEIYVGYINPLAEKVQYYFLFLGWEDEARWFSAVGTSLGKAVLCICFFVGTCVCCSLISYARLRKRET